MPLEPITSSIIHENNSQGVLWEFVRGARRWTERQRRFLCVGGELNGQRLTKEHIKQSKWPNSYHQYNASHGKATEPSIWVFI